MIHISISLAENGYIKVVENESSDENDVYNSTKVYESSNCEEFIANILEDCGIPLSSAMFLNERNKLPDSLLESEIKRHEEYLKVLRKRYKELQSK